MKRFLIIFLSSMMITQSVGFSTTPRIEALSLTEEEMTTIEDTIVDEPVTDEPNYEDLYFLSEKENDKLRIEISKLETQIKSLNKEIITLQKKAGIKSSSIKDTSVISDDSTKSENPDYKEMYIESQATYKELKSKIVILNKNIKSLKKEIETLNKLVAEQERLAKLTPTLRLMEKYDYVKESSTGLTFKNLSLTTLNKNLKEYGKLYNKGMPYNEFKEAMNYEWTDCTDYKNKETKVSIDITKTIDYDTYVSTLKKLSRYDGVYLYKIGKSTDGRDLYSIEIDVESNKDKNVIMLTGSVHAREFAGGTFLLKSLADLIQQAQTDSKIMNILKANKYVAVPIINVDCRENLINDSKKWSSGGQLWKAYSNGTDGNRNFPGLAWGEVSKGNSLKWNIEKKPGRDNYAGDYAGSNNETKAMMKWIYHYAVIEKADCLLDYHQQGRGIYAGKEWATKAEEKLSTTFRTDVLQFINKGNSYKYGKLEDEPSYGLNGTGSTITDYACGVAFGAKFSPAYGFNVLTDGKKEYSLLQVLDMDKAKFKIATPNKNFKALTIEIGAGTSYLGNSSYTRTLLKTEYTKYHFDTLLKNLPNLIK